jgi:NAD+ kinase
MKTPFVTFGIFGNTAKPETAVVTMQLLALLRKNKVSYVIHDELGRWMNSLRGFPKIPKQSMRATAQMPHESDVIIALGGDGTMLRTARVIGRYGKPILGVNIGKLGFLAEISPHEVERTILELLDCDYIVEERAVLEAQSTSDKKCFYGLNDIVIDKGSFFRVISIETYVDNDYLNTYTADGIILTAPTGSTGYSLSTGGPIVAPQARVITINPIAPHMLTARPVVIPDSSTVRIIVQTDSRKVHLTADGQEDRLFKTPAEFIIKKAPYTVKLVKRMKSTFYDTLRKKLLWGKDPRVKQGHK